MSDELTPFLVPRRDRYLGSFLNKKLRSGQTDAVCTTGDNDHLVL
jgi:hypothetical protein